jgi:hypothetical protein
MVRDLSFREQEPTSILYLLQAHQTIKGPSKRPAPGHKTWGLCIFSPFFCWTPARYRTAANPALALFHQDPIEIQLCRDAASASSIRGKLDAGILAPQLLVGPDNGGLSTVFSVTRNAEHDEALSLIGIPRSGSSVRAALAGHRSVPMGKPASMEEFVYRQTRRRYAGLLQRALRHTDIRSLQKLLESVKNSPPTTLTRRSA